MFIELCPAAILGIKIMKISDLYFAINSVWGHVLNTFMLWYKSDKILLLLFSFYGWGNRGGIEIYLPGHTIISDTVGI